MSVEEEVKRLRAEGKRYRDICRELRVSPSFVREVLKGPKEEPSDPLNLLEKKAEQEERKAKALRKILKAREMLNEPAVEIRVAELENFVTELRLLVREIVYRLNRVEEKISNMVENERSQDSFKKEIEALAELKKLELLDVEIKRKMWGF